MTSQQSPEPAPAADPQMPQAQSGGEVAQQDMTIIQLPHEMVVGLAQELSQLTPIVDQAAKNGGQLPPQLVAALAAALSQITPLVVQAAQKSASDIESQKAQGAPGTMAPDQPPSGPDNANSFNSQMADELTQMRSAKR